MVPYADRLPSHVVMPEDIAFLNFDLMRRRATPDQAQKYLEEHVSSWQGVERQFNGEGRDSEVAVDGAFVFDLTSGRQITGDVIVTGHIGELVVADATIFSRYKGAWAGKIIAAKLIGADSGQESGVIASMASGRSDFAKPVFARVVPGTTTHENRQKLWAFSNSLTPRNFYTKR